MSRIYRGKEFFKPLNTGRIDEHVSCIREWIANIFFYTKDGTTIMIDAGYNYDRLAEKISWLDIDPSDIKDVLKSYIGAREARQGLSKGDLQEVIIPRLEYRQGGPDGPPCCVLCS